MRIGLLLLFLFLIACAPVNEPTAIDSFVEAKEEVPAEEPAPEPEEEIPEIEEPEEEPVEEAVEPQCERHDDCGDDEKCVDNICVASEDKTEEMAETNVTEEPEAEEIPALNYYQEQKDGMYAWYNIYEDEVFQRSQKVEYLGETLLHGTLWLTVQTIKYNSRGEEGLIEQFLFEKKADLDGDKLYKGYYVKFEEENQLIICKKANKGAPVTPPMVLIEEGDLRRSALNSTEEVEVILTDNSTHTADHYEYRISEKWMTPDVPFGIVKHKYARSGRTYEEELKLVGFNATTLVPIDKKTEKCSTY